MRKFRAIIKTKNASPFGKDYAKIFTYQINQALEEYVKSVDEDLIFTLDVQEVEEGKKETN